MATTKRERQKAARRIKMEEMERRAKRRQNTRRGIIVAIVAILVLGTGALLFAGKSPTTTTTTSTAPTTTTTAVAAPIVFSPVTHPNAAGVFGKSPVLVVPAGAPPTKPELANLITGTGPAIAVGDKFTAQYVLADYASRKVLQSSWPKGFSDTLVAATPTTNGLISGWVAGMVGMKVGGRRELILPPDVAYGPNPSNGIPKNDTLVFIIDLLKVTK
jgi:peptidylprolyl isomerase